MPSQREYPSQPIVGVGGVIVSNGRALLIKRGTPPLEGQWSIPGGLLEIGETLMEGVRRALREETGMEARPLVLMVVFERIELDGSGRAKYHYVVQDYLCERTGGEPRAGSDVTHVVWARPEELGHYSLSSTATRVIMKAFEMARASSRSGDRR